MLNLKSSTAATTAFTLLLLINNITALPTVRHQNLQSASGKPDPSINKIPLEAQPGFRYPVGPELDAALPLEKWKANMVERYGPESTTKILSASSGQTKTKKTSAGPALSITAATSHGKEIVHHSRSDDNHGSSNNNNNNNKEKDETPLVRIFLDGNFSPFTTEESQRFLLLLHQKLPKVVGAGSYPPHAPESINEVGRMDSKESSVYNKSRRCENNGQWCRLPQEEGIVLIAGPGIRACTYYKEEGKIISNIPC